MREREMKSLNNGGTPTMKSATNGSTPAAPSASHK